MKAFLKNNTKIIISIIITAIICVSLTAYATRTYYASDILYNNTTLESTLDSLYSTQNSEVSSLNSQVTSLTNANSDLESQIQTKNNTISSLESQITTKDETISTLQSKVTSYSTFNLTLCTSAKQSATFYFGNVYSKYKYITFSNMQGATGYTIKLYTTSMASSVTMNQNQRYSTSGQERVVLQGASSGSGSHCASLTLSN